MATKKLKVVNVPNLRFMEFEGEWKKKKLGDLGDFVGGGTPTSSNLNFWSGNIPWVSSSDLVENNIYTLRITRFITQDAIDNSATKFCVAPVILIVSRVGVGKVAYSTESLCTSQDFTNVINMQCNGLFLCYFLSVEMLKEVAKTQGTSIKGISTSDIKCKQLFVPKDEEQQKIASFLTLIDKRISTQRKIIEQLETLSKGLREKLFSQQLRFKDDNGKNFVKWETKKLREVCEINPKSGNLPSSFIYIDLESVVDGMLLKEERIEKQEAPSRAQRILRKGDVLFQMVRPYQKNNFYFQREGDYVASTGYAQIRTTNNSQFIFQYLHYQKFVDEVIEKCTGTSYPAISSTDLSNIFIEIPSVAEQTKIANFLSVIDKKTDAEKLLLEQIEMQKRFLLQNLFI